MADGYDPPRLRAATACVACNKKKVRCIFEGNERKCQNCTRHKWPCFQRESKRRGRRSGVVQRPEQEVRQGASPSIPLLNHNAGQEMMIPTSRSSRSRPRGDATQIQNNEAGYNPYTSITAAGGFMERNDYFREESISNDDGGLPIPPAEMPSDEDIQLLRLQRAFEIPPRAVRDSLIDVFMVRCAPWMPIVERCWLDEHEQPSILLLQAVFLAASRVTSAPAVTAFASSHEFYRRAKALFWAGWEKNPLTVIAAVCMLHWYNPECPEHVSTNTSSFWRYVGVGLAHQIGLHKEPPNAEGKHLRRRLWWSLFARDSLISAGQGRPMAVNLEDTELKPPCVEDFRDSTLDPNLFIAYVEICCILGDLTQSCRRESLTRRSRQGISESLKRWIQGLPPPLRLFKNTPGGDENSTRKSLSSYNLEARQLHIPYFICMIILSRFSSNSQSPSATVILASTYVVATFEDFLARDEIQYLGSIFTFHLLAAGIGLLSCRGIPRLWAKAAPSMETIYASLSELAKRWPSAMAPLRVLQALATKRTGNGSSKPILPEEDVAYFDTFGPGLTWAWEGFMGSASHERNIREQERTVVSPRTREAAGIMTDTLPMDSAMLDSPSDIPGLNIQHQIDDGLFHMQYEGIGDWLLNDRDIYGSNMA